jgi:hypothetical protein
VNGVWDDVISFALDAGAVVALVVLLKAAKTLC